MHRLLVSLPALSLLSLLLGAPAHAGPYTPDLYWPQSLPAGTNMFTAVSLDNTRSEVYVAQRSTNYPQPVLVFDKEGNLLRTWGNDTISKSGGSWGVHGLNVIADNTTAYVFITDVGDHTVKKYDHNGKLLQTLGTRGRAGSSLSPLQFGDVADIDGAADWFLFVGDGDGGVNNRVVAVDWSGRVQFTDGGAAAGSALGQFSSPHSVAYYDGAKLLFVADRGNNRTQVFSATTGKYLADWTCTQPGAPWGVRAWSAQNLLFVADGGNHNISILDLSAATPSQPGDCNVLTFVPVDPTVCNEPHEIAIDASNGELYVACVGTPSHVMRFKQECAGGRVCAPKPQPQPAPYEP